MERSGSTTCTIFSPLLFWSFLAQTFTSDWVLYLKLRLFVVLRRCLKIACTSAGRKACTYSTLLIWGCLMMTGFFFGSFSYGLISTCSCSDVNSVWFQPKQTSREKCLLLSDERYRVPNIRTTATSTGQEWNTCIFCISRVYCTKHTHMHTVFRIRCSGCSSHMTSGQNQRFTLSP